MISELEARGEAATRLYGVPSRQTEDRHERIEIPDLHRLGELRRGGATDQREHSDESDSRASHRRRDGEPPESFGVARGLSRACALIVVSRSRRKGREL
jgi:hypothetical protein